MIRLATPRWALLAVAWIGLVAGPSNVRADLTSLYADPVGDTFGVGPVQHDITSMASDLTTTDLTFTVTFANPIFAPSAADARSVVGFLDLDRDRNAATGTSAADSNFTIARGIAAKSGLGVEAFFDLFSEISTPGSVALVDAATFGVIGSAPITFTTNSFSITAPLSLLGGDGLVNFGVIVGTFLEATDEAQNPGLPPATTAAVPEPSGLSMVLIVAGCLAAVRAVRGRRGRPRPR